jgi:ArsR family transcriptional regulator, arsenate/arsenite/antimonite-responsive transcriptional repressor
MQKPRTPSEIGERAEIAVMAALVDAGLRVLVPFGGYHRFDLAFENGDRIVKVQCKSGRMYKGVVVFSTSDHTIGALRHYRGEVDLFGVYCHERREVYVVPVDEVPLREASLRVVTPRNNQKAGIRMADDYLIRNGRLPDVVERFLGPSEVTSHTSTDIDIVEGMPIQIELREPEVPVLCCSPLDTPRLNDDQASATATLFKALADPHRVRIVNLLSTTDEAVCVCDITEHLGLSQSTVSFHLKKLVSSGLLTREQRGTWAYYAIDPEALDTLTDVVRPKGSPR